jgi:hypothetical protein
MNDEHCWRCCGYREIPCFVTKKHPTGYETCPECKGMGYGESLQTMWKRKGIVPKVVFATA